MKNFNKNLLIYGIIPVISKASGFLLLPFYVHYLNSEAFGYMELFLTLFSFATLLINLEIYTAIGRYFYDYQTTQQKKKLISSGLILTVCFGLIVGLLLFIFNDFILTYYIKDYNHASFYIIGVFYVVLNAYSTYLSVIPRYDNKAKIFTVVNSIAIIIKLISILFCLLYLKIGLLSVIIGHLMQVIFSSIAYTFICKKYLGFVLDKLMLKQIMSYALPLMPFIILIGLWEPLSRYFLTDYFSTSDIGLLNFCLRLVSILELINAAIQMTWMPMLYENKEDPNFKQDTVKLTRNISMVLLLTIAMLTVLSPEIIYLLNAENFGHAVYIINFVFLFNYFKIMVRIRGYLPYINNKTYMLTIAQIISFVFALTFIFIFKNSFGIVGLAIFLLLPYFINYIFLTFYTEWNENVKFHNYKEIMLFIIILFLSYFHYHIDNIYVRAFIFAGLLIYFVKYFNFVTIIKNLYAKR